MKPILVLALCFSLMPLPARAASVALSNQHGATLTLADEGDGWGMQALATPDGATPQVWQDRGIEIATADQRELLAAGWNLVEADEQRVVLEQEVPAMRLQVRRVISFGPADNVLRIETRLRSLEGERTITRVGLLNVRVPGEALRETGVAPASFPLFGTEIFAGIEHISGEAHTSGRSLDLSFRPRGPVGESWQPVATCVIGWPLAGMGAGLPEGARMRSAFLRYLDSVRVKPDRIVLHSETWWTMMPPLDEKMILADIETLRRDFHERTGMFFDTYCLDLGWSNPQSFWQIAEPRFPNRFRTINERLNALGARLGLWFSPGSGYPEGLNNTWLAAQGYAMTPFGAGLDQVPCFAEGTRYQREFRDQVLAYAREFNLGHVIFDFMAQHCDVATHGHPVGTDSRLAIDAGVAQVLDGLRDVNPGIALEPMVCGYPPSPWWLMKTPFILGPAGDDVPIGRGPCPEWLESLITARDVAYRAGQEAWLMPTQALETWDLVMQTPGDFENLAVMAIGRGRWFLSCYLKPSLMKPEDWDFLAALVRWARENKEFLGNAWQIGGRPEDREAYGYMFRHEARDLFCVRNPWIESRSITLPAASQGPRELRMLYPRRAVLARMEAGEAPPPVEIGPYETVFLESVPAGGDPVAIGALPAVTAAVAATPLAVSVAGIKTGGEGEAPGLRSSWVGAIDLPAEVEGAELCVLVEASELIAGVECEVFVNGRAARVGVSGSAGQFGAAITPSPEQWVWCTVPIAAGRSTVQVELRMPLEAASIGIFLRGGVAVPVSPASGGGAEFPVFRPNRRPWSQTLAPLQAYPQEAQ